MKPRILLAVCIAGLLLALPTASGQEAPRKPTPEEIDRTSKYLVQSYTRKMETAGTFAGLVLVMSISEIDHPSATQALLDLVSGDKAPAIRAFACGALHTRRPILDAGQQDTWVEGGCKAAIDGGIYGAQRMVFLKALAGYPGSAFDGKARKALLAVLAQADHRDSSDHDALAKMRRIAGIWRNKELAQALAIQLAPEATCNKAEYVLGGLDSGIAPIGSADPRVPYLPGPWRQQQLRWQEWIETAELNGPAPGALEPYTGKGDIFPEPKVVDPWAQYWRKKLELDPIDLNRLEICFAIDSTNSMEPLMRWVSQEVRKMAAVFSSISGEVRTGVVFFRDEPRSRAGDDDYRVRSYPLTSNIARTEAVLRNEGTGGGRSRGAAMLSALEFALKKQGFSRSSIVAGNARKKVGRVIVMISDTYPLHGTEGKLENVARKAHQEGFVIHGVQIDGHPDSMSGRKSTDLKDIAAWGGGTYLKIGMTKEEYQSSKQTAYNRITWQPVALPRRSTSESSGSMNDQIRRQFVEQIIRGLLPDDYKDQVAPLIDVLLAYVGNRAAAD